MSEATTRSSTQKPQQQQQQQQGEGINNNTTSSITSNLLIVPPQHQQQPEQQATHNPITTQKPQSYLTNVICTAYASLAFFSLWIPAYFCSVLTNKITNLFGWDIQKSFTSVFMRWSSRLAVKLNPFWTVRVKSTDKAPKGNGRYVFVCNHQSNMDPILINSVFKYNAKWVSKDTIFNIPFGGYMMNHCGDIPISFSSASVEDTTTEKQSAKSCMHKCKEWLELNVPIFMFPEGRRSKDGGVLDFKKGAFILAKQTDAQVVPCAIHGTMDIWPVAQPLPGPGKCVLIIGDVFDSTDFKDADELTNYSRERVMELQKLAIEEHGKI